MVYTPYESENAQQSVYSDVDFDDPIALAGFEHNFAMCIDKIRATNQYFRAMCLSQDCCNVSCYPCVLLSAAEDLKIVVNPSISTVRFGYDQI